MLLLDYITTVYVPSRIALAPQYQKKLFSVAAMFSTWLGRPAGLKDLTQANVCGFLCEYRTHWTARSTNNQRGALLSIWADAADNPQYAGCLSEPLNVRRIRKLPEELDPPEAWTEEQVCTLVAYTGSLLGNVGQIPAADWWTSLVLAIYWTSCRITSMLAVPSSGYDGSGILVRKQKNHRPQWYPLPASCCELIERTAPQTRKRLWPHPWHPDTIWGKFRKHVEAAGMPAPKSGRQLFHRLRRTTISLCAAVDPSIAQRTAGHASYATTLRHYVDPRIVRARSAADVLPDPLRAGVGGQGSGVRFPAAALRLFVG
jgi:hypothetical protein